MQAIVAVAPDWGIGDGAGMLYHLPGDLKYFREQTQGHTVIMGRKTLDSLPGGKPLPKRRNIVLTRDQSFARPGVYVCHDIPELLSLLESLNDHDPFVIGGGEIYRQLLPYCRRALVTRVEAAPPLSPCVFFPDLKEAGWREVSAGDIQEESGIPYRFTSWEPEGSPE